MGDIDSIPSQRRWADNRVLAAGLLLMWAVDIPLAAGLTTGSLVAIAMLPVWIGSVRKYRWGPQVFALAGLALISGALLAFAQSGVRPYSEYIGVTQALHIVAGLGGAGLVLWARGSLRTGLIAAIVGVGLLVASLNGLATDDNLWKYALSVPVSLVLLGALDRARSEVVLVALGALAVTGALYDARSYVGFCALTGGFLLFQRRRQNPGVGWGRRVGAVALAAVVAMGLYSLGTAAMVDGYLGSEVQQRTQEQIERAGSLLSGGRPEWSGTIELMKVQPAGFGLGAQPTYADVWTARIGLDRVGVGTDNGYVDKYMFGREFKLHSAAADLWSQCGILGLALAAALFVVVLMGMVDLVLTGTATAVVLFLGIKGLWDIGFSPIYTGLPTIALAVGLLFKPLRTTPPVDARGVLVGVDRSVAR